MEISEYIDITRRTEAPTTNFKRDDFRQRLLFGAGYLVTETNEVFDHFHRVAYRGEELDRDHVKEELGDVMYGIGIILRSLDLDMSEVLEENANKLNAIYGEDGGYSSDRNGVRKSISYNGKDTHK